MIDKPVLYVFMRTDLPDHSPGKALAQCNHAGTDFVISAGRDIEQFGRECDLALAFKEWIEEGGIGGSFGTCVVLGCTHDQLLAVEPMLADYSLISGLVIDPTYPIRNGHQIITAEVVTCGWAFVRKSRAVWSSFDLY